VKGATTRTAEVTPASSDVLSAADVVKALAGTWRAPEYRMERDGSLDEEVFGPRASDVRNVELAVQPSGEAALQICSAVVDAHGKTFAPTLFEAKLSLKPPVAVASGAIQPVVSVNSVDERYLDSGAEWARQGYRVSLTARPHGVKIDSLVLQFDTPRGDGSFWTTLVRERRSAHGRLASSAAVGQCGRAAGTNAPARSIAQR
jgi:hypothetical protein